MGIPDRLPLSVSIAAKGSIGRREMADWQGKIPGCFGGVDRKLRALELLNDLVKQKVTRREASKAFRAYLESKSKNQKYIEEEMSSLGSHFGPWLERG
jgi:hypothetical protein